MPRPNRYHPYTRTQVSTAPVVSPRFPPPPGMRQAPRPMPSIAEQQYPASYQYAPPLYIQAVTCDGKPLAARSIMKGPDGMFHIQMQVIQYPSEVHRGTTAPYSSPVTTAASTPTPLGPSLIMGLGIKKGDRADSCIGGSQDGKSPGSRSEECAILSDDEDAEGELEGSYADRQHELAIAEQRRIMDDLLRQGWAG
ncbi:hypothetical protein BDV95DRAFT_585827 [Massariosphaeria phaeospora]|uniref:Uncharacterized protein n=1 Tax=Massariosphaeria phaeospora TaxID=100035 RepID=A0A7C8I5N1_9PLEO|nr:hypothetical protein BDV95DRAFT_585827 [Massariosphaeria phaeospora]